MYYLDKAIHAAEAYLKIRVQFVNLIIRKSTDFIYTSPLRLLAQRGFTNPAKILQKFTK